MSQQRESMEGILGMWKGRIVGGTVYQQLDLMEGCFAVVLVAGVVLV